MPEITTVIVGTKFRGAEAITAVARMRPGDEVRLARDARNRHDANAVECHYLGVVVGFVPKITNPRIAKAMDAGIQPSAKIVAPATIKTGRVNVEPKIIVSWPDPSS